jgi:hypothetical protein
VPQVPIVVVESPYRALVGPLIAYLDVLDRAWPPDKEAPITFVVLPEYVAHNWWERILYNQSAKRLRSMLLGRPHTVVVNVPYRREARCSSERTIRRFKTGPDHRFAGDGRRWYRDRRTGRETIRHHVVQPVLELTVRARPRSTAHSTCRAGRQWRPGRS